MPPQLDCKHLVKLSGFGVLIRLYSGAGSSYIDSGCPGTCSERIQQPSNFAVRGPGARSQEAKVEFQRHSRMPLGQLITCTSLVVPKSEGTAFREVPTDVFCEHVMPYCCLHPPLQYC